MCIEQISHKVINWYNFLKAQQTCKNLAGASAITADKVSFKKAKC